MFPELMINKIYNIKIVQISCSYMSKTKTVTNSHDHKMTSPKTITEGKPGTTYLKKNVLSTKTAMQTMALIMTLTVILTMTMIIC